MSPLSAAQSSGPADNFGDVVVRADMLNPSGREVVHASGSCLKLPLGVCEASREEALVGRTPGAHTGLRTVGHVWCGAPIGPPA